QPRTRSELSSATTAPAPAKKHTLSLHDALPIFLHSMQPVLRRTQIHFVHISTGFNRIHHQLVICILCFGWQFVFYAFGFCEQIVVFGYHTFCFIVLRQAVSIRRQQFRLSPGIVLGVETENLAYSLRELCAELLISPLRVVFLNGVSTISIRVPG